MKKSPDAFRTISEVADWLGVAAHVLRFWESQFSQIRPVKRAGGRRYYRPSDMLVVGGIKALLHDQGLSIRDAQRKLREDGIAAISALSPPLPSDEAEAIDATSEDAAWHADAAADAETGDTAGDTATAEPVPVGPPTSDTPDTAPEAGLFPDLETSHAPAQDAAEAAEPLEAGGEAEPAQPALPLSSEATDDTDAPAPILVSLERLRTIASEHPIEATTLSALHQLQGRMAAPPAPE